ASPPSAYTAIYPLSLHDALPIFGTIGGAMTIDESGEKPVLWLAGQEKDSHDQGKLVRVEDRGTKLVVAGDRFLNRDEKAITFVRSEEHTSELQSRSDLVCRLLLE